MADAKIEMGFHGGKKKQTFETHLTYFEKRRQSDDGDLFYYPTPLLLALEWLLKSHLVNKNLA